MTFNTELWNGQAPGAEGYQIERSLRFNSSDSAYLSRTPSVAGNRKTWTWAGWVKLAAFADTSPHIFGTDNDDANRSALYYTATNQLGFYSRTSAVTDVNVTTTAVYRDYSAWYHIVLAVDTNQATPANVTKIYVNGVEQDLTVSAGVQNALTQINNNVAHSIGRRFRFEDRYLDGYLADIHFIDGQALDPTSFTEVDATTGQLVPIAYTGTFGTNGFHLPFSDNSTAAALGTDTSGNSNTWTVNNISVTAGAGNDSLVDTPTNGSQTDTGVGGEVVGNYATLNPLVAPHTYSNGNLDFTFSTAGNTSILPIQASITMEYGKWYAEVLVGSGATGIFIGIWNADNFTKNYVGSTSDSYSYWSNTGNKYNNASNSAYGSSFTAGDLIGVAFDADAGTLTFYKNGVSQGVAFSGITARRYVFAAHKGALGSDTRSAVWNFGQRPFAYTAPSGYKALCTTNLDDPLVAKPSEVMDVKLYTGNGGTQTISGLGFSPDLVWIKSRVGTVNHVLTDTVRGAALKLASNTTGAEAGTDNGYLSAFTSDGFTVAQGGGAYPGIETNYNPGTPYVYAAWAWDAGSSTVTNEAGSITSQVRANASAGFSIVGYTGNATAGATVGHGLNDAPAMYIVKRRNASSAWYVYHKDVTTGKVLILNATDAENASSFTNSTEPTSSVFTLGSATAFNASGSPFIAYCFAPVAGYSSFGSYTGNGSADGPFVFCNFRPRWIMFKCSSTNNGYTFWEIVDTARPNNLAADLSDAEGSYNLGTGLGVDILSNGFKIRGAGSGKNISSQTYIYAAFAESPFQYARAR